MQKLSNPSPLQGKGSAATPTTNRLYLTVGLCTAAIGICAIAAAYYYFPSAKHKESEDSHDTAGGGPAGGLWCWRKSKKKTDDEEEEQPAEETAGEPIPTATRKPTAEAPPLGSEQINNSVDVQTVDREFIQKVLQEILTHQSKTAKILELTVDRIIKENLTLEETYSQILQIQPNDPLEQYGLSLTDFATLLDRFEDDEEVVHLLMEVIDGNPSGSGSGDDGAQQKEDQNDLFDKGEIIKINEFMRDEFERVVLQIKDLRTQGKVENVKTASVAAQAYVSAMTNKHMNAPTTKLERSIEAFHVELTKDKNFCQINLDIQAALTNLVNIITSAAPPAVSGGGVSVGGVIGSSGQVTIPATPIHPPSEGPPATTVTVTSPGNGGFE